MRRARTHLASALLAALAVVGILLTHNQRQGSARDYADAARYNRAITTFLHDRRAQLVDRHVAVLGVSGLSPFSLTGGRYLTRLLGAPASWHVYVPRSDPFYSMDALPDGMIIVRPESVACEIEAFAIYVVFDSDGGGRVAKDCRSALEAAHPVPEIDDWVPRHVTRQAAAAGFDVAFVGRHLGGAVGLRIDGRSTSTVHARRGKLMTATIPPDSVPRSAIPFTVEHRGHPVFEGRIDIGPEPERRTPDAAGGFDASRPRPAIRP